MMLMIIIVVLTIIMIRKTINLLIVTKIVIKIKEQLLR